MKSQLLQSCQGCAPSTISPILTFPTGKEKSQNEGPIPTFFMKRSVTITSSNTTRTNSRPLGRVREGPTSCCFFLPPTADFLNGQRPLFEPWRLLSSCKAWRWGWRRRHGGKLVFRLPSPTATKRRSQQQPPWLFVLISTTNRSN